MRILKFLIPLALFVVIAVFLYQGLSRDPREIPSPLIGKAAPDFALPVLSAMDKTWSPAQMKGKVWLLNVWGSWCAACQVEHPLYLELAKSGTVPIVGLAWKDAPDNAKAWLARFGDPFTVTVLDFQGKVAIDYGVYGAPETFLIDKQGVIRFKHVGPLTRELIQGKLQPLIASLQAQAAADMPVAALALPGRERSR